MSDRSTDTTAAAASDSVFASEAERLRFIAGRGRVAAPPESSRPIAVHPTIAAITLSAIAASAVPLLMLDPQDNDGAASMIGLFGIPMLASALIIQVWVAALKRQQTVSRGILWWPLAVLPLAVLALGVPSIVAQPEYYEATSVGGFIGVLVVQLVFILLCLLLGAVVWFFIVMPATWAIGAVGALFRGDRDWYRVLWGVTAFLVFDVFVLVGVAAVDPTVSGRAAAWQLAAAVLGVPGRYDVIWEPGLWIVRAFMVGGVLVYLIPAVVTRWREHRTGDAVA